MPIAWSADGRVLLAGREVDNPNGFDLRPTLIRPSSRTTHSLDPALAEIDMLSRDGRLILGVLDGNVVSVRTNDGAVHILAHDAASASWNR